MPKNKTLTIPESPLVQINLRLFEKAVDIDLNELPFMGHLNLRGRAENKAFLKAAFTLLGIDLPLKANTFVTSDNLEIYWLGPDEWLIITAPDQQTELEAKLRKKLKNIFSSVTDVSSGQTIITIGGSNARALIEKACTIDLHPRQFSVGDCAQTRLAKTGVLIAQIDDKPVYEIIVRRSFSDYLGLWLQDAVVEFIE